VTLPEGAHTTCPACHGWLFAKLLKCTDCGLEGTTRSAGNEFADLGPHDQHLLRIFVLCKGRIRDMEASLGISYPTVKSRLAALRDRLGSRRKMRGALPTEPPSEPATARQILDQLAADIRGGAADDPRAAASHAERVTVGKRSARCAIAMGRSLLRETVATPRACATRQNAARRR
jgi:hypothetical protein